MADNIDLSPARAEGSSNWEHPTRLGIAIALLSLPAALYAVDVKAGEIALISGGAAAAWIALRLTVQLASRLPVAVRTIIIDLCGVTATLVLVGLVTPLLGGTDALSVFFLGSAEYEMRAVTGPFVFRPAEVSEKFLEACGAGGAVLRSECDLTLVAASLLVPEEFFANINGEEEVFATLRTQFRLPDGSDEWVETKYLDAIAHARGLLTTEVLIDLSWFRADRLLTLVGEGTHERYSVFRGRRDFGAGRAMRLPQNKHVAFTNGAEKLTIVFEGLGGQRLLEPEAFRTFSSSPVGVTWEIPRATLGPKSKLRVDIVAETFSPIAPFMVPFRRLAGVPTVFLAATVLYGPWVITTMLPILQAGARRLRNAIQHWWIEVRLKRGSGAGRDHRL